MGTHSPVVTSVRDSKHLQHLLASSGKSITLTMSSSAASETSATVASAEPVSKPPAPQEMQKILASKRMAQQQAQVDEVVGIMRTNVEKVLERDSKLGTLDERADALQSGASLFETQAGKLKHKFWQQNTKWIILGLVVVAVVMALIYYQVNDASGGSLQEGNNHTDFTSAPEVVLDNKNVDADKMKTEYNSV